MVKNLSFLVLFSVLANPVAAQNVNPENARSLAEQATQIAREGKRDEALRLYREALAIVPEDISILRDYAVVLGWNEEYKKAIPVIENILSKDTAQPDWALREFARTFLFGDATEDALDLLDVLVERGDYSEDTLSKRALAMRWLGKNDDAEVAYRDMLRRYPESGAAYAGLAYVAADRNRISDGLETLDSAPAPVQSQRDILVARIQLLNWMGRHYEAQRLIAALPPDLANTRDILRERISASRWGGNPSGAMHDMMRLVSLYPDKGSQDLLGQLRAEYGHALVPNFRYTQDSDGQIDRALSSDFTVHLNPSHALRAGYQYRWIQQGGSQNERTLVRYELGWSAALTRRLSVYTTMANVDYRNGLLDRKFAGDASVSAALSDSVRIGGGGGKIVMDAYQSIDSQVMAPFGFAELSLNLGRNRIQSRVSKYFFTNDVRRTRFDAQFLRPILMESAVRVTVGFRSGVMTHSSWTPDFYSPSRLQSYFGVAQFNGRITSSVDFYSEVAGGWQSEQGSPLMHPFQVGGGLGWRPNRHFRLFVDGGKSTASVDRIAAGWQTYSRWSASGGLEIRFP
jgi:tetratricopeptide (TPR) repeat protein